MAHLLSVYWNTINSYNNQIASYVYLVFVFILKNAVDFVARFT